MSTKDYIKFSTYGAHPHLEFLTDYLIKKGFAYVGISPDEVPDFLLVGGLFGWEAADRYPGVPVLLLSDDSLYSDRDFEFKVREKVPMKEDDPIFIPSPLDVSAGGTLNYLLAENNFLLSRKTMVLRIFNVYGPSTSFGLIHRYASLIQEDSPLPLYSPGYQTRTFLHEDDLCEIFDRMLRKFLTGTVGIFNVGSEEETSIKRLVDSMWQIKEGAGFTAKVDKLPIPKSYRWWVLPDLTRTKAMTRYKPRVTLRTGLWQLIKG